MILEQFKAFESDGIATYIVIKRSGDTTLLSRSRKGHIGVDYFVALKHDADSPSWKTLIPCVNFDSANAVFAALTEV